jgi:hypothetical protein
MKWIGIKEECDVRYFHFHNSNTTRYFIPWSGSAEQAAPSGGLNYFYYTNYIIAPFSGSVYSMRIASNVSNEGNMVCQMHLNESATATGSDVTTATWTEDGPIDAVYPTDWNFNAGDAIFISLNPSVARNGVSGNVVLKYNTYGVSK